MKLNERHERAAILLAEDRLSDEMIAQKVGITDRALYKWKNDPDFAALLEKVTKELRRRVREYGIASVENRIAALNDRWRRMNQVIEERAAAPETSEVPGGTTGLLCRQVKSIGRGDTYEKIEVFAVDDGLLAEIRNTEKQAAQELGQWTEKSIVTGDVVVKQLRGVSLDDL